MEYDLDFSARKLDDTPRALQVGQWTIEYQAYSRPENLHATPMIFLSGAFQNFRSFRYEVTTMLEHFPVILLDLPSQGNNLQLAPELDIKGLADLIPQFLDACDVEQAHMIGVSYGSLVASMFAIHYPERIGRLLLSGTTAKGRPALRLMLEESFHLCSEGSLEQFAHGAVSTMINGYHIDRTGMGGVHRKLLLRQVLRLADSERERFLQNTRRLLDFDGFEQFPACPTLVATGELDHFTMPHENAHFSLSCKQATFALIRDADHMSIFARREGTCALFLGFARGDSLKTGKDFTIYKRAEALALQPRISPRLVPIRSSACIIKTESGDGLQCRIEDINYFGARVTLSRKDNEPLPARKLQLHIEAINLALPIHTLEQNGNEVRCQFIHMDLSKAEVFRNYLLDDSYFIPQSPMPELALEDTLVEQQLIEKQAVAL
ncbi:alpha/beta fold hydrolase [Parendozoicomonas haliclonae]|uniref:AB hydrolase superfamily protein YvaM n=1 Tax=Parendozoicomonas haliclonae TaxID=1960125 RepID=A0A1X7AH98_9GAMM|nr:alpha/beta hydrolase [Parendozoicomonas haliclonae]SMA40664.1 AB hydrolase superfamily protein YvaM [Parendozoicomonas haliclonae]